MLEDQIEAAAKIIAGARTAIAFTGAGISAESGIPTFRDPGGIWERYDPGEIGTVGGLVGFARKHPDQLCAFLKESLASFEKAQPNPGHYGLAELEEMGLLRCVVTQNGDDLHSIAGSKKVYEVHGNLYRFKCLSCGGIRKYKREEILGPVKAVLEAEPFNLDELLAALPRCECSGFMRPDVVMFGEAVQDMPISMAEARTADLAIVLGTSGVVWPAAGVPYEAKRAGAKVIEINPNMNAYRDITDVYLDGPSGEIMPRIMERVRALRMQ